MNKIKAIFFIVLGIFLIILSLLQALNLFGLLLNLSSDLSSYGIGQLVGSILGMLIFGMLGYKSLSKGRSQNGIPSKIDSDT